MNINNVLSSATFLQAFYTQTKRFTEASELPISGLIFEERVHRALLECGVKTDWSPTANSHASGADILGYSLKTNKLNKKGSGRITSYRTATWQTWEDKKKFIEDQDSKLNGYLFLLRQVVKETTFYNLYLTTKEQKAGSFFDLNTYKVKEDRTDRGVIYGNRNDGANFAVCASTSGQLIFGNIPSSSLAPYLLTRFSMIPHVVDQIYDEY